MKRTIMKYGKYNILLEEGWMDRWEMRIVLIVSTALVLVLAANYVGLDVISAWVSAR